MYVDKSVSDSSTVSSEPKSGKLSVIPCGHVFHFACINASQIQAEIASKVAKCPQCNNVLIEKVRPMPDDLTIEEGATKRGRSPRSWRSMTNPYSMIDCLGEISKGDMKL